MLSEKKRELQAIQQLIFDKKQKKSQINKPKFILNQKFSSKIILPQLSQQKLELVENVLKNRKVVKNLEETQKQEQTDDLNISKQMSQENKENLRSQNEMSRHEYFLTKNTSSYISSKDASGWYSRHQDEGTNFSLPKYEVSNYNVPKQLKFINPSDLAKTVRYQDRYQKVSASLDHSNADWKYAPKYQQIDYSLKSYDLKNHLNLESQTTHHDYQGIPRQDHDARKYYLKTCAFHSQPYSLLQPYTNGKIEYKFISNALQELNAMDKSKPKLSQLNDLNNNIHPLYKENVSFQTIYKEGFTKQAISPGEYLKPWKGARGLVQISNIKTLNL